jgi:cellulose synthase/poly-beta-1,6-N-acetylglucosamine synthase-like glycosyltransferase
MIADLIFWGCVAWLAYVYAGYPALLALLGLFRRVRPVIREDFLPSVSVLISARNEEKDIGWKVNQTLAWDYPSDRLEVLVASDASDDRTDDILRNITDKRLRFVRVRTRGGKIRALNTLAEQAKGDLLFFTDANASIEPGCLRRMVRHFADGRVGCVTGTSRPLPETENGAGTYFSFESWISSLESRLGSVLVADGAIHCALRALYTPLDPNLANDLELPLRIGHAGFWTIFEPEAIAVERETSSSREEFNRRRRICAQGALGMWRLRRALGGLRGWQFVSHKFLRWLTLVPLVGLLLAGWPLLLLVLALLIRPRVTFYVLLGAAGALSGVVEACFGRRFDVWTPPSLTRGIEGLGDQGR